MDGGTTSGEDALGDPLSMFVLSHDALFASETDQTIPPGWSARPNRSGGLFASRGNERETLLEMLRRGVPPALRCAVWTTNAVWAANPDMDKAEVDENGTLKRVRALEHGWNICLKSCFPDESDEKQARIPECGLGDVSMMNLLLKDHNGKAIPEAGAKALKRVLFAAHHTLGVDYCPLLPDIAALLLTAMDESYAYATIRQMLEISSHFVAQTKMEHLSWCKTFSDLMKRLYPQTHAVMAKIGLLNPKAMSPIFERFFVTVLKMEHVKRLLDLFTLEGKEVLFRFGTALMCLYHAHLSTQSDLNTVDAASWWKGLRAFTRSRKFGFDVFLEKQVYAFTGGRFRRRSIFPRAELVDRLIEKNEEWVEENVAFQDYLSHEEEATLGFVETGDGAPIVLARQAVNRTALASWLPPSLTSTKLEILYSSNVDGRTVDLFYHHCSRARHTITLLEVLGKDTILGMYATQMWKRNTAGYGDAECFIFRLRPNPACFKWKHTPSAKSSTAHTDGQVDLEDTTSFDSSSSGAAKEKSKQRLFADQVMVSGDDFISMGIGKDGASGLRINEDLTKGSSSPAMGFGNESLLGDDSQVFDIGLVEVYRFVREVDGQPVDSDVR